MVEPGVSLAVGINCNATRDSRNNQTINPQKWKSKPGVHPARATGDGAQGLTWILNFRELCTTAIVAPSETVLLALLYSAANKPLDDGWDLISDGDI
jgi:hypothetical protein